MSKYAPLRDYLQLQSRAELELTFKEIEGIIGSRLPTSADRPVGECCRSRYDARSERSVARRWLRCIPDQGFR